MTRLPAIGQKLNILIYLSVMLGVFPLYFFRQYEEIGTVKYTLFCNSSLIFFGIWGSIFLVQQVIDRCRGKGGRSDQSSRSFLDIAVLSYANFVLVSYLFSDFKQFALWGADGWQMGLYAQLIFIGLYFILSYYRTWITPVFILHFISSGLVFLLGILHRFDVDPVGMYPGLTLLQKQEFLSTIGQATWYSSYVCTVFGLGLMVYYFSKRLWVRIGAGIYMVLSFATLVTQNSDSAFMAVAGVLVLLGCFSWQKRSRLIRFWQILTILWGTFGGMGILQRIFSHRMIPLDSLSLFFSQHILIWVFFAVCLGILLVLWGMSKEKLEKLLPLIKKIYIGFLVVLGIGILFVLLFIYLNTKGYLQEWFGFQSTHSYLLFDYQWGNNRGSSWIISWQEFLNMPFLNKLIGVGPDCFSAYLYSVPKTESVLRGLWGNLTLTNAHNEYLNHLICYGIAGLLAWLTVLVGGVVYFYRKAKENPCLIGFALCITAYALHNIFCYQQVCCTPFLFILLGLGEGLTKWEKSPTIIENE